MTPFAFLVDLPRRALTLLSAALIVAAPALAQVKADGEPPRAASAATGVRPIDRAVQLYTDGHVTAARRAFLRLARQGNAAAHYNLAVMQLQGEWPQARLSDAVHHMTTAARSGFVTAMFGLAQLHDSGRLGRADPRRALAWYTLAAEAGSIAAAEEVGTAHYLGRGTAHNPVEALRWFRTAATGGEVGAQYLLASMYETGQGTAVDLRLAAYWYDIAARNGDVAAPGKLEEVRARIAQEAGMSS